MLPGILHEVRRYIAAGDPRPTFGQGQQRLNDLLKHILMAYGDCIPDRVPELAVQVGVDFGWKRPFDVLRFFE